MLLRSPGPISPDTYSGHIRRRALCPNRLRNGMSQRSSSSRQSDILPTMVGPSKSRPPMSHRKTDLGIPCRSKSAKVVLALAGRLAQRGGGMRQILDVDARQRGGEGVLGLPERRHHHLAEQRGAGRCAVHVVGRAGGAQNIVRRDAALLAGELIAARGAHAARRGGEVLFVYTDSGVLDQLGPLEDFGFDPRCEFRWRVGDDLHAKVLQMLARIIAYENTCRLAVKL